MKKVYSLLVLILFTSAAFAQGTWHVQAQFGGSMRYRAVSFVVNGKCYVGTGSTGGGISQNLQDMWEYDPATNAWTQVADLAGPKRTNATGASDATYGYVGLGSDNGTVLDDWWQYDPSANTWLQKASIPAHTRYGAGSFTISNKIFVGGGIDSNNTVYSDFFLYDPGTDTWTSRHALPAAVTSMGTFVINGKGYFVGGATNGSVSATTQTAEYDPVADTWTLRAPYAGGNIFSCVGFSLDNMGYVGTGFCGNLTTIMYRFDPATNLWTQETDFPNGIRQWAVCCNVNNRAFVGTGNSTGGNLYNDWWEFVPVTTGIHKTDGQFPPVYFDNSSHQIVVKDAMGTESFDVMSIDGKLVLTGMLEKGNNLLYVQNTGVFMVRLHNNGREKVVKIVNAE